jgi:hypothetical protein
MWRLFLNYCKCVIKATINVTIDVQCRYMRSCHVFTFPPPIMGYICNYFLTMIPIDTISTTTNAPLLKYYRSTML